MSTRYSSSDVVRDDATVGPMSTSSNRRRFGLRRGAASTYPVNGVHPENKISIAGAAAQDEPFAITVPIHGPPSQIVCGGAFSKTQCGSSVFCFVLDSTRLVLLLDANSILPDIDLIQARPDPNSSPIRSDLDRMRLRRDPTATWTRLRRDWARARPDPIQTRPAPWILDRSEVELGRAWPGSEGIFLEPGRSSARVPVQRYVQRYVQR